MSLSEAHSLRRHSLALGVALALVLSSVAGCTVRPLYSNSNVGVSGEPVKAELASIAIKPVTSRYAQEVRNQLIFLFNGGKGQPADSTYSMDLRVTARHESAALVQRGDENEPTAGLLTLSATYIVTDNGKGHVAASGTRQITSSYDLPRQEFAAIRAKRDAEDRAARELAQLISLAVAQEMSTR